MSEKKSAATGTRALTKSTKSKSGAQKSTGSAKRYKAKPKVAPEERSHSIINQTLPFIFLVCALILVIILAFDESAFVTSFIKSLLFGLFSYASYLIPALLVILAAFWQSDVISKRTTWKLWCALAVLLVTSTLFHLILSGSVAEFNPITLYQTGDSVSGGVFGGILASILISCFGKVISYIIVIATLLILVPVIFGMTPVMIYRFFRRRAVHKIEDVRERRELERLSPVPREAVSRAEDAAGGAYSDKTRMRGKRRKFDPDVDVPEDKKTEKKSKRENDEAPEEREARLAAEVMKRSNEKFGEQKLPDEKIDVVENGEIESNGKGENVNENEGEDAIYPAYRSEEADDGILIDLEKIFTDPDKLRSFGEEKRTAEPIKAERSAVVAEADAGEKRIDEDTKAGDAADSTVPVYEFPPLELLTLPPETTAANREEIETKAKKLVDTLSSFNVHVKISDVSRGPTITRYELTPESGTRVRAISNLVEDISLNLASPGVRIEAPIPGKSAVGVEVPNSKRENVYLRALISTEKFKNAKSRLTAALGEDVAGDPVYCDIAKMPHLLISGATGMGKSVCLNAIIVSLLYKAEPTELRLIMIDPKKVELNLYNGIPHLHVPVVSDPKKAAGTLSWAVTEMDKRYAAIEDVGMRNIEGYNEITKNDPEKEFMPQMIIIIDELADLMMTAPDDVETSICRIAQMGRAAGLHLIIGTQRPSVDVITGLIKANIPSRIAFKMSSQVDSRTVIDIGGAEKLLGFGDMLYASVGVMKPVRIQGAFVTEEEVEAVTDFLRGICPTPNYDSGAIEGIDEAAARCGQKRSKGAAAATADDGGADSDPMLMQALELAVESGKISTSLIQRRLSLGYGRAAKLIDRLEAMGYVSPPDGQRPRDVLITRDMYRELMMRGDIADEGNDE
ncbi:MAG: DNA translocase FtsK [Firmicutes bacterium]|nr:DNA translocase FtsK [Bacillota bacterium]